MAQKDSSTYSVEQERYKALIKACAALFVALTADLLAVAFVHAFHAPWWAWAPFPLFVLVAKAAFWNHFLFRHRADIPPPAECSRRMRIVGNEVILGICVIVAWQVWLIQWSTPETLLLLSLCLAGQVVFLLFGLLHLRAASLIAAGVCVVGTLIVAANAGSNVGGVALLLGGGLAGLAYVAYDHHRDFIHLFSSRLSLQRKAEEILALSEENFRIANTDMLTEIGNRRRCFRDLDRALDEAGQAGRPVAFGIIDLDGFKTVNDCNGHLVGDRLLRAMAERLQTGLSGHGEVYRLGGDEFALILGEDDEARLLAIGQTIIETVHTPIQVGELRLMLGCSVGFAAFPKAAQTATELYDRADYALFHAKRTGRMRPVVFSAEHERSVRENALVERTLLAANLDEELYLTFQPIVDSSRNRTLLLECLARWQSPVLGLVSPGKFIVVAENSGFISTITPILLRKALEAVKQWPEDVGISFNLSGHDIVSSDKVMNLIGLLARSGVSPRRVEFEVTETALMMNLDEALANIHHLKAAGVRISLDDFGTGYSSLSQIQKLPLDKIKVDGSFVRDLASSEASRKIISSVSALSRDLSLSCVVEGVETQEQLDILQGIGCSLIQGYFFSKPMREDQVQDFLDRQLGLVPTAEAASVA